MAWSWEWKVPAGDSGQCWSFYWPVSAPEASPSSWLGANVLLIQGGTAAVQERSEAEGGGRGGRTEVANSPVESVAQWLSVYRGSHTSSLRFESIRHQNCCSSHVCPGVWRDKKGTRRRKNVWIWADQRPDSLWAQNSAHLTLGLVLRVTPGSMLFLWRTWHSYLHNIFMVCRLA